MIRFLTLAATLLFTSTSLYAELIRQEISYPAGNATLQGYLVYDSSIAGERPGVLVVHEWWGHNDYARTRADLLAAMGYTAFAVDMYGEGKRADHPKDAGAFAGAVRSNLPLMRQRFLAAQELLRQQESVNSAQIAAIGYCFGGGVVLEMARQGIDLRGVVSFHGSLEASTTAQPGVVKAAILVANGAADPMVSEEQIEAFQQEMERAGVDFRLINYPEAKHSFTNPDADRLGETFGLPLAYHAEADKKSWQETQDFLQRIFQPSEESSEQPSEKPSEKPSEQPSEEPSEEPSEKPSKEPSEK